jgi:hypothetical protein
VERIAIVSLLTVVGCAKSCQDNLRNAMFTTPWNNGFFVTYNKTVTTYGCPSDARWKPGAPNGGSLTSYLGVTGNDTSSNTQINGPTNGFFQLVSSPAAPLAKGITIAGITDGTSNTVMVGERPPATDLYWGWWGVSDYDCLLSVNQQYAFYSNNCVYPGRFRAPIGGPQSPDCGGQTHHFWSYHTGGANWAIADGGVRFMSYNAGSTTILDMGSAYGGEVNRE